MPISTAPYTRKYHHTKSRGSETTVTCGFCGRMVPRYKTFTTMRGFRITDPSILKEIDPRFVSVYSQKIYACPSCARHRGIIKPGKTARKIHMPHVERQGYGR
ncbi:MAG: hypothetical protein V1731_02145 [Candidatus Aenigmatarchaeota archaeon]